MNPNYLNIRGVGKTFKAKGKTYEALSNISLHIAEGEFVSLIGPSGCGKTTLLNLIAGLDSYDAGSIDLDGEAITGPGLDRGVVFQNHALFPWMSVLDNIMFALDCAWKNKSKQEKREWAIHCLQMVQLGHALDKKPSEISGGMKQRVGIARAFAVNPKVLLLDEPFGALDALTRESLQIELQRIWSENRRTVVLVTHDVDEAILLSDRIVVMSRGPAAELIDIIPIEAPHPRNKSDLPDFPGYRDVRSRIIDKLSFQFQ
jgi:nitrate/nitrite transport system ATP-binding protein